MSNLHNEYYPSNINGLLIVNAITGIPYSNMYVGTKNELNFFRVIDSTGNYDNTGRKLNGKTTPNKLFFDNKEQYINFRLYN